MVTVRTLLTTVGRGRFPGRKGGDTLVCSAYSPNTCAMLGAILVSRKEWPNPSLKVII
jgi:hypothetical protein